MTTSPRHIATGLLAAASCLLAAGLAPLTRGAQPPAPRFRPLGRASDQAADAARDRADRLSEEYSRRFRCPVTKTPEETTFFWQAVAAYREVVTRFAGSEIAAYCHRSLVGLFVRRGHLRDACELALEMSREFAGTKYRTQAYLAVAGTHADGFKDALGASRWLRRVGPPPGTDLEEAVASEAFDGDHGDYLTAQLKLIECEAHLGALTEAEARWQRMRRKYPHLQEYVDKAWGVRLRNADAPTLSGQFMRMVDDRIREDACFLVPISPQGTVTGTPMRE